jgi:hypothetical protein
LGKNSYTEINGGTITTTGENAFAVRIGSEGGGSERLVGAAGATAILNNVTVSAKADAIRMYSANGADAPETLVLNGGSVTSTEGSAIASTIRSAKKLSDDGGKFDITISGGAVLNAGNGVAVNLASNTTLSDGVEEVTVAMKIETGSIINGDIALSGAVSGAFDLDGSTINGSVTNTGTGTLDLTITNDSAWTNVGSSNLTNLTLDNANLHLTLNQEGDAITASGNLTLTGTNNVAVDFTDAFLAEVLGDGGTYEFNVNDLITGSTLDDAGGSLAYAVLDGNDTGSTWTVEDISTTRGAEGWFSISNIDLAPVPEPATWAAFAGLAMLVLAMLKRRSSGVRMTRD